VVLGRNENTFFVGVAMVVEHNKYLRQTVTREEKRKNLDFGLNLGPK
jgi:hypothetical protein